MRIFGIPTFECRTLGSQRQLEMNINIILQYLFLQLVMINYLMIIVMICQNAIIDYFYR